MWILVFLICPPLKSICDLWLWLSSKVASQIVSCGCTIEHILSVVGVENVLSLFEGVGSPAGQDC